MASSSGRTTIALTAEANAAVDDLCIRFSLKERTDAAKLGIAFAVRKGLDPAARERSAGQTGPAGTTWNVGGFDSDGKLRELVMAVYPEASDDPYGTLENLMNVGILDVADVVRQRRPQTLAELIAFAD